MSDRHWSANFSANFCGYGVSRGQRDGTPTAFNLSFLDRSCYFFSQVAPHLSSRGWVDTVPDPPVFRKSGSSGNRTRERCSFSQELWPLDQTKKETRGPYSTSELYRLSDRHWITDIKFCNGSIKSAAYKTLTHIGINTWISNDIHYIIHYHFGPLLPVHLGFSVYVYEPQLNSIVVRFRNEGKNLNVHDGNTQH
jgi:hypothetical protein